MAIRYVSLEILTPHSQSSSNGLGTGESGVLQDGSVTVGSGTNCIRMCKVNEFPYYAYTLGENLPDDTNIVGVLDGGEDSSSEDDLAAEPKIEGERNQ